MSELFPVESVQMDSPRLAWMKRHRCEVVKHDWTGTDFEDSDEDTFQAYFDDGKGLRLPGDALFGDGWGQSGDDAIAALCSHYGVPLWNEESP